MRHWAIVEFIRAKRILLQALSEGRVVDGATFVIGAHRLRFLQQIKVKVPGARKNCGSMRFAGEHGRGLVHPPPFFVHGGYVCFTPSLLARAMPLFTALGFLRSDLKVPVADNHGAKLRIHRRPDRGARAVGAAIPERSGSVALLPGRRIAGVI
jgi:hypothetical protein